MYQIELDLWHVRDGERYFIKPDHRDGSPLKSQWAITKPSEVSAFHDAPVDVSPNDAERWGLHLVDGRPTRLGTRREYVARFLGGSGEPTLWHGFPANSWPADRPPSALLDEWVAAGVLTRARSRKLRSGKWRL